MANTMKMYVIADETAQILGVSRGHTYKIIRGLNNELKENGYQAILGKVSTKYFEKNFMVWQLVDGEEIMICQLQEIVKHGVASSIMRTGRAYSINKKNKRGFKTKAEAEEWKRNFPQQQRKDLDISFENFVEIYFIVMENRLRESTIKNRRYVFDLKVTPYFKKMYKIMFSLKSNRMN